MYYVVFCVAVAYLEMIVFTVVYIQPAAARQRPERRAVASGRRGPALSGRMSRKKYGSVPIADRPSVHCVPVIVRALGRIKAEGTHKERPQTRIALAQERYRGTLVQPRRRRAHDR